MSKIQKPLFMNIRNLLILALAGKRTIVVNAELSIGPRNGEATLVLNGNGGLFCNIKAPSASCGMSLRIDQWGEQ